jgi:NAD(P)-dependent dehydrogenase (short-subunit alcohol dehydrogenase family)
MRVVITGAAGNIGRKLIDHLGRQGDRFTVPGLDIVAAPPYASASHDLSVWEDSWVAMFRGADVVVHLAAEGSPDADWPVIVRHNVDLLLNVYEAARLHAVGRIVFASSNWVLGGYRFEEGVALTADMAPRPAGAYGAAKLFAERQGKQLSQRTGMSVINLRLGANPAPADDPGGKRRSPWDRMQALSDRDLCQAFEKAITVPRVRFATLTVTSRVIGSRWDLSEAERVLGYVPVDEYSMEERPAAEARGTLGRLRERGRASLRRLRGDSG